MKITKEMISAMREVSRKKGYMWMGEDVARDLLVAVMEVVEIRSSYLAYQVGRRQGMILALADADRNTTIKRVEALGDEIRNTSPDAEYRKVVF